MRGKWIVFSVLAMVAGVGAGAFRAHWAGRRATLPAVSRESGALLLHTNEITITGSIHPQHVLGVGAAVEGNIDAFLADVGDEVFEGQSLARIGSAGLETAREQAQADVEHAQDRITRLETAIQTARSESSRADADAMRARLEMERAQKVFDRQTTLHAAGATPRLTYEKAQQDFQAAQRNFQTMENAAQTSHDEMQGVLDQFAAARKLLAGQSQELQQAQAAMANAEVYAPVSGTVVGRNGELGKPAQEVGDRMFQIATDLYALEVQAEPRPADLVRIHPGQAALVLVLDLQSSGMPGTVKEIKAPVVVVEFAGTIPGIKPGMRADVRVKVE